jgi:L-aspartate oxidase
MSLERRLECDVLVIGAGIAGLSAAITAAEGGLQVVVLSKELDPLESNTRYAQGGIVGLSDEDTHELLEKDIMFAGAGINFADSVRLLVNEGPELVDSFLSGKIGVPFTKDASGKPALTREAAHSVRRILYAQDQTGEAIEQSLMAFARKTHGLTIYPGHTAIDFITNVHNSTDPREKYRETQVFGAYAFNEAAATVTAFFAPVVVSAAGGVGNLYLHTSNPIGATGDGIAMAYRVGTEILNAEYVQFHPTVLFHRDVKRFLISEALRGEGARLKNRNEEYFMERYSPDNGDLAPRDEVARAIYREMEQDDADYVSLDATKITELPVEKRFPAIFEKCLSLGIDMRDEPIPVVPAAHYFCGGVKVDLDGRTSITGLYAAGENACTGVHGANRLASISLLEGLYWGVRCATQALRYRKPLSQALVSGVPDWIEPTAVEEFDPVLVNQDFRTIQSTMWNYAGIIRSRKRLLRAQADLDYLSHRIEQFYRGATLTRRIIELRNSVLAASIIVHASLANPVSKGCHYIE